MGRILEALKDADFLCYAPSGVDYYGPPEPEEEQRPVYRPFESPAPTTDQIQVEEKRTGTPQLFRYFVDGSMRTTSAGHIVDNEKRYLPIFIAQIGVGATRLDNGVLKIEEFKSRNVFFLPNTFPREDEVEAKRCVVQAVGSSRYPMDLECDCYALEERTKPMDAARKKVLASMHGMEIELIKDLAESGKLTREAMLMIDGSLQFYGNLEREREAFRNVAGVAKSFDLHQRIGSGRNLKQIGTLVAELRPQHRTPARKVCVSRTNLKIAAWYLRLHSTKNVATRGSADGVVKLEIFPEDAVSTTPKLDADRCQRISESILALRHPTTSSNDPRWASHLYPIHITERYIKTRFRSERAIKAYL